MKKLSIMMLSIIFLGISCTKTETPDALDASDAQQISGQYKVAQELFEATQIAIDHEAKEHDGLWDHLPDQDDLLGSEQCISMVYDENQQLKSIRFGWNETTGQYKNCLCRDQKERRGEIQLSFSGGYFAEGSIMEVDLINFYINDFKVEGDIQIKNQFDEANGEPMRILEVKNGLVTSPEGWKHQFYRSQEARQIRGVESLFNPFDNIYSIEESGGGVNANGTSYTYETSLPLIARFNCEAIWVDGVVEINAYNFTVATYDMAPFSDFDEEGISQPCDYKYSITDYNGNVQIYGQ